MEDELPSYFICCASGIIVFLVLLTLFGDSWDLVDTKQLGMTMCQQHNLTYAYRTFNSEQYPLVPTIYCKETSVSKEIPLEDGYLLLIRE